LPDQWKESIILPVHKKGGISLSASYKILSNNLLSRLSPYIMKLLGITSVRFDVTERRLIRIFAFFRYWRKKWEYNETVHQLFIDFKRSYDSVRREVLYNILIEFRVPKKLDRLIKISLN
jgi:hypothetical protein